MLIRNFHNNDIEYDMKQAGIKKCKRTIHLFVNKEQYHNGTAKFGRAVLINESLSDGNYTITKIKIPNSSIIRITTYYFDVTFNNVKDLRESIFTLTESFGTERVVSYDDKNVIDYETSQYSLLINSIDGDLRDWLQVRDSAFIPPPNYYNEMHMYYKENDFNSLYNFDTTLYYNYNELIDEFTTINIYNIDFWDTMNSKTVELIDKEIMKGKYNIGDVSTQLYTQFIQASISDSIFIYDTDLGTNIKGGIFPFYEDQLKSVLITDIRNTKNLFELTCKEIQSKYGNIRVHMKSNIYGDSYNIICKDYNKNNQPFNLGFKTNNILNIDRSYPTVNTISELLSESSLLEER